MKRPYSVLSDDNTYSSGRRIRLCEISECNTPSKFSKGGIKNRCLKHGGYPLCHEPNCTSHILHEKGGMKNRCSKHGGKPKCEIENCITPATFRSGGIRGRCIKHGGLPHCDFENCMTPIQFCKGGLQNKCTLHGGSPLCQEQGCITPAVRTKGGIPNRCVTHGGRKLCNYNGCSTPIHYRKGGVREKCSKHGGIPLCQESGCSTPVQYIKGGLPHRCFKHDGAPKCAKCNLFTVTCIGTTYTDLCIYCVPRPNRSFLLKEHMLKNYLDSQTDLPKFSNNESTKVCSGFRPDFKKEFLGWTLFIECDENQHKSYNKEAELQRMKTITDDQGWFCVFIRFNPDTYHINHKAQKFPIEMRYIQLKNLILHYMDLYSNVANIPTDKNIDVEYMFYNKIIK